jgi:DNA-binding MarR family transcriptional regulator
MPGPRTASAPSSRRQRLDESYSLGESIPYQIHRLAATLTDSMRSRLRRRDINISQWRVLTILRSEGAMTVGQLSVYAAMKQPVVSRILGEMEAAGFVARGGRSELNRRLPVARGGRAGDQRVVLVSLTAAGNRLFNSLRPLDNAHRRKVATGFSAREIDTLRALLGRIERNFGIEPLG